MAEASRRRAQRPVEDEINLRVLRPSRRAISAGDVFAFSLDCKRYYFGRVIRLNVRVGMMPNGVLIYLFGATSENPERIPTLDPRELLLPPLATNRLPWRRGYFRTVESRPVAPFETLPVHCFRDFTGRYFDEMGNVLQRPVEPVGEFALHSFRSIDDLISDVLGVPRVT